ncbi:hypothetical protein ACIA5D_01625 [Actinoplanes sp. NPDC051513]|uniref:hypothetical protein n=1 Tax=Actinoplanes sp. NPDC051513 TaxID=3363908 RepID=UPI0037B10F70
MSVLLDNLDGILFWTQIADLRVVSGCVCGCPTVDFRSGPDDGLELIADAKVSGTDGDAVLLFGRDGVLDRLEYMCVGGPPPAAWPAPEMLFEPRRPADVVIEVSD